MRRLLHPGVDRLSRGLGIGGVVGGPETRAIGRGKQIEILGQEVVSRLPPDRVDHVEGEPFSPVIRQHLAALEQPIECVERRVKRVLTQSEPQCVLDLGQRFASRTGRDHAERHRDAQRGEEQILAVALQRVIQREGECRVPGSQRREIGERVLAGRCPIPCRRRDHHAGREHHREAESQDNRTDPRTLHLDLPQSSSADRSVRRGYTACEEVVSSRRSRPRNSMRGVQ